jgi:hypothetical protein
LISDPLYEIDGAAPVRSCSRDGSDDSEIVNFLNSYVGRFNMYVEGKYVTFDRYGFRR